MAALDGEKAHHDDEDGSTRLISRGKTAKEGCLLCCFFFPGRLQADLTAWGDASPRKLGDKKHASHSRGRLRHLAPRNAALARPSQEGSPQGGAMP